MNAICYKCGAEKSAAIKLCDDCHALPITQDDRFVSVCLSADCLKQKNLRIASSYIQEKDEPPGFHSKVVTRARQIVAKMPEEFQLSQSISLSDIFEEDEACAIL